MYVKIDTYKPLRGLPIMGYKIYNTSMMLLASGDGFHTKEYLDHAIALRKRALVGLRPERVRPKYATNYTMRVVESWNDQFYGVAL